MLAGIVGNCRSLAGGLVEILIGPLCHLLMHFLARCGSVRTFLVVQIRFRHFVVVGARWVLEPSRIILLENDRLAGEEVARVKI